MQNGEHTDEWPAADRPLNGDDSDAPVTMGESSMSDETTASAPEESGLDFSAVSTPVADVAETAQDADANARADADAGEDISDADNVEITNGGARDIDATTVNITQGGARDIEATTVTINQGGAGRVSAEQLTVSQGGVGLARAEQLTLQEGGNAFAVVADKAHFDAETSVFLLISGSTSGEVKPVLDWRAALAIGAGFALVLSAMRRLRR
jgi:hypothetical protein